ncbi:ISKra4 family transposase [bacterium]|nr:ISKra4 family transposase [bacterium]
MLAAYTNQEEFSAFSASREHLDGIIHSLLSPKLAAQEHSDVEHFIQKEGTELLRKLLQGYLDVRASTEIREQVVTSPEGKVLNHVRANTRRNMTTLFGDVNVTRIGYSQRHSSSVFPLDQALNLPQDQYSYGLRKRLISEAIKGSFDESVQSIKTTTGGHVPKRQALMLVDDASQDFCAFYERVRFLKPEDTQDLLVMSFDGKGVVMRHESLRTATKKAAENQNKKLQTRLSQGEKRNRKRMAQVATVYTVKAHERTAESIMKCSPANDNNISYLRPRVRNKRVWASVQRDAIAVIEEAFREALQRDPQQSREWVILVDGHPHQIKQIKKVMKRLKVKAVIIQDFIHVLEYLWKATWCFHAKGSEEAEAWVAERALNILQGKAGLVAAGMKRSATKLKMEPKDRSAIDDCASYLLKSKPRLQYAQALAAGHPIATGIIEGACRHLINDRLDITGARWGLQRAEAVLKLRSINSSGDFEEYWAFHKQQSKQRLYGTKLDISI